MAGRTKMVLRMAGLLILFLLLSFAASPASAHASHGGFGQTAPNGKSATPVTVSRDAQLHSAPVGGVPGSHRACNTCPSCCGTSACPMFSATMASGPSVTAWLPTISASFGRGSYREVSGLHSIPRTRPPRLDA